MTMSDPFPPYLVERPTESPVDPAYRAELETQLRVTAAQLATHINFESVVEFIDGADLLYQWIIDRTKPEN